MVSFEEFAKLDIRVARVDAAEKLEGSDKLLKLVVEIGAEQRTLIAGIGKSYSPEELIGKKIVVLTNLEPRVIKGIKSQGMLLAAGGQNVVLLTLDKEVELGARVS
ncbi:methionine--tRNA ligase subunit beta [Candidatus Micrarchaeota archaeon]|nr:methionine--tRNA ligase subunit beta [Candidatus Micrarchaeota archaeon]